MEGKTETTKPKTIPSTFEEDHDPILGGNVVQRDYAKTGAPIAAPATETSNTDQQPIERIDFDFNSMDLSNAQAESEEYTEAPEIIEDSGKSSEEVAIDKRVQSKIAKSQSKNIINVYIFILLGAVKWFGKYDESKLIKKAQEGELSLNELIGEYSIIQHIRNGNQYISELTVDEDAREVMVEALEIYLISQNIQTSPGINLMMALATPAVQLFMDAYAQKREMKKLVQISMESYQANLANNEQLIQLQKQNADLQDRLRASENASANNQPPIIPLSSPANSPAPSPAEKRSKTTKPKEELVVSSETIEEKKPKVAKFPAKPADQPKAPAPKKTGKAAS